MSYTPFPRPNLAGSPQAVHHEIDDFQVSVSRFQDGRIPEAVFLEHRLRFGVYGQRQDGVHMMRSKLPLGLLSPEQLDAFADLTEQYSAGTAHLTTRQDIQVHFIKMETTPEVMRVLASAEMTSREACGNVVRNVCCSVNAGVAPTEAFDVTPYGMALAKYLLRHPDGQELGRKFKITLASTQDPQWNLTHFHDIGATAAVRNGKRGFHLRVGGGLGAVPHEAQVLTEFLPEEELLPVSGAILRIFARHGEKKSRARARLKFLVAAWGIERFAQAVWDERRSLPHDPQWTDFLGDLQLWTDRPTYPPHETQPEASTADESQWLRTNVYSQKQPGYASVKVRVPRGDLRPHQLRGLAKLLRTHVGDSLRIGEDQSLFIRHVALDRLLAVRQALLALELGEARAGGLGDTVTCPGADTCKLGITSPRSVARQMQPVLDRLAENPRLEKIRIKISGCPNSCSQHQVADIGLFGASKSVSGVASPHFVLLLGGLEGGFAAENAISLGTGFSATVIKIPAMHVGRAIERLCELYLEEAGQDETWGHFARRLGRQRFQSVLKPLTQIPTYEESPDYFREHGCSELFTIVRGKGECAGEVVTLADMLLARADQASDHAVALSERGAATAEITDATSRAFQVAAQALLSLEGLNNQNEYNIIAARK